MRLFIFYFAIIDKSQCMGSKYSECRTLKAFDSIYFERISANINIRYC
jgi:hypothetical protein